MSIKKKLLAKLMLKLKKKKLSRKGIAFRLVVGIFFINIIAIFAEGFKKIFSKSFVVPAVAIAVVAGLFVCVFNVNDKIDLKNTRKIERSEILLASLDENAFSGNSKISDFSIKPPSDMTLSYEKIIDEEVPAADFIKGKNPYFIKVNRKMNCVTVYTYDDAGEYTVPVKAFACSVGLNNETPTGHFGLGDRHEWCYMVDGSWGMYAIRISGAIMFHSVPYLSNNPGDLEWDQYNKLGEDASLGCVRMAVADVKWLYDNCPQGTEVEIYDGLDVGPLGKPETIKISSDIRWDPTDTENENNPWNACAPCLNGVKSRAVKANEPVDLLSGIKALDSCGNDITSKVSIKTDLDLTTPGSYEVTYTITDVLGRSATQTATFVVIGSDSGIFNMI